MGPELEAVFRADYPKNTTLAPVGQISSVLGLNISEFNGKGGSEVKKKVPQFLFRAKFKKSRVKLYMQLVGT